MIRLEAGHPLPMRYAVRVRNLDTDHAMDVLVSSYSAEDAQVAALHLAFKQHGWRRCTTWPARDLAAHQAGVAV